MTKRFGRNDIIYLSILSVIMVLIYIFLFLIQKEGDKVVIKVDGEVYGEYSLRKEQEITISTKDTNNTIVISDGCVNMQEASCPDKICMHQKGISKDKESIVCLPNKVIISVESNQKEGTYDAIVE